MKGIHEGGGGGGGGPVLPTITTRNAPIQTDIDRNGSDLAIMPRSSTSQYVVIDSFHSF